MISNAEKAEMEELRDRVRQLEAENAGLRPQGDQDDGEALAKRVAELEAENATLREEADPFDSGPVWKYSTDGEERCFQTRAEFDEAAVEGVRWFDSVEAAAAAAAEPAKPASRRRSRG